MSPAEDSKCIYATEMQKMRIFNKYILFSTYAIGWRGGGVEGWRGGGRKHTFQKSKNIFQKVIVDLPPSTFSFGKVLHARIKHNAVQNP
jgi:hypothetical protein